MVSGIAIAPMTGWGGGQCKLQVTVEYCTVEYCTVEQVLVRSFKLRKDHPMRPNLVLAYATIGRNVAD